MRTHHCSSSSLSWTLSATVPSVTICPLLPSIANYASVHEASVAGLAPPPNNRRKGSRFRHRRATVVPSLRPLSHHRRATVAPPLRPLAHHRHAASVVPSFTPPLRLLSCHPSCLRHPTSPQSPTATTWRQTLHCCSVSLLRRVSCTSFAISNHRCTANLPGVNSKRVIFFPFCIFFMT